MKILKIKDALVILLLKKKNESYFFSNKYLVIFMTIKKCSDCGTTWFDDLDSSVEYVEVIRYNVPYFENGIEVIKTERDTYCRRCWDKKTHYSD